MKLTPQQVRENLQFEGDRLVRVRGVPPEFMSVLRLIAQIEELAVALRDALQEKDEMERLWGKNGK